jgi:hypothetical protein
MVATVPRRRRRHAATVAGLLLLAALALYAATLLAREQAIDAVAEVLRRSFSMSDEPPSEPIQQWEQYPWVRDRFRFEYGFWIATGTLFLLGMVNVARAVPIRSRAP